MSAPLVSVSILLRPSSRNCQEAGVWAFDASEEEAVVFFPVALALLGDNPMQSELCSHIGLRGRLFCRVCWAERINQVKRRKGDAGKDDLEDVGDEGSDGEDEGSIGSESDVGSEASESSSLRDALQEFGEAAGEEPMARGARAIFEAIKTRLTKYVKVRRDLSVSSLITHYPL